MIAAVAGLSAWASVALLWPGLRLRAPVPDHILLGGSTLWNTAFRAVLLAVHAVKLLAIPMVVGAVFTTAGVPAAVGSAAVLIAAGAGLGWLGRRRPRSCAEPLRDEAGFLAVSLGICLVAGLGAGSLTPLTAIGPIAAGWLATIAVIVALAAGFGATWGARPSFVVMRRPTFRILGDNPDAHTVIARVRVDGAGLRVTLPRIAEGPVTFTVYDGRLRALDKVPWDALRGPLEKGQVTLRLGPEAPSGDDFHLALEPGRYMLSVRNYRPWDRATHPRVEALR